MSDTDQLRYRAELYRKVFDTEAGRQVLADIVRTSDAFSLGQTNLDHATLAYIQGRRDLVLQILFVLNIPLEKIIGV